MSECVFFVFGRSLCFLKVKMKNFAFNLFFCVAFSFCVACLSVWYIYIFYLMFDKDNWRERTRSVWPRPKNEWTNEQTKKGTNEKRARERNYVPESSQMLLTLKMMWNTLCFGIILKWKSDSGNERANEYERMVGTKRRHKYRHFSKHFYPIHTENGNDEATPQSGNREGERERERLSPFDRQMQSAFDWSQFSENWKIIDKKQIYVPIVGSLTEIYALTPTHKTNQ